jgi:NAD(P)-dependent dehydrogenase (short-subunit alcohol dehydrogenase family)
MRSPLKMPEAIVPDTILPDEIPESHQTPANAPIAELFSLRGRTVVVTGAGRGLGITLATAVLEAGGDVVCLDILPSPSEEEWSQLKNIQKTSKTYAKYHQCDITNEEAVISTLAEAAEEADRRRKPIRGLISCAGIQQMIDAMDYPSDGFRRILEVNVTGSFLVAKRAARILRDQGTPGSIVFIASMSGQIANRVSQKANYRDLRHADHFLHRASTAPLTIHPKLQSNK